MLRVEKAKIGDFDVAATQWPFTKAAMMKLRIAQTVGPALFELTQANVKVRGKAATEAKRNQAMGSALSKLFESANPTELIDLIKDILHEQTINGTKVHRDTIDSIFSPDNMIDVYKIVFFVVKLNFGKVGNFTLGQVAEGLAGK